MVKISDAVMKSMGIYFTGKDKNTSSQKDEFTRMLERLLHNMGMWAARFKNNINAKWPGWQARMPGKTLSYENEINNAGHVFSSPIPAGSVINTSNVPAGLMPSSLSPGPGMAASMVHGLFTRMFSSLFVGVKHRLGQLALGIDKPFDKTPAPGDAYAKTAKIRTNVPRNLGASMSIKTEKQHLQQSLLKTLSGYGAAFAPTMPGWFKGLSSINGVINSPALRHGMKEAGRWLGVNAAVLSSARAKPVWDNAYTMKGALSTDNMLTTAESDVGQYKAFAAGGQWRRMVSVGNRGVKQ